MRGDAASTSKGKLLEADVALREIKDSLNLETQTQSQIH